MGTFSTTEAEYVALGDGVKKTLFAKSALYFVVPFLSEKCFELFIDNKGAAAYPMTPLARQGPSHRRAIPTHSRVGEVANDFG